MNSVFKCIKTQHVRRFKVQIPVGAQNIFSWYIGSHYLQKICAYGQQQEITVEDCWLRQ